MNLCGDPVPAPVAFVEASDAAISLIRMEHGHDELLKVVRRSDGEEHITNSGIPSWKKMSTYVIRYAEGMSLRLETVDIGIGCLAFWDCTSVRGDYQKAADYLKNRFPDAVAWTDDWNLVHAIAPLREWQKERAKKDRQNAKRRARRAATKEKKHKDGVA